MDGRDLHDRLTSRVAGPPALRRRAVVAGTCASACLAAIGGLAGCAAPAPEPAGDTPAGGMVPPTGLGAGSPGAPVGPSSEVPVGGGRIYPALEMVVTRPDADTYRGFTAVCTHDGCILDKVADGLITCPCHGSRYRLDGTVERGPAESPLARRPVRVVDGTILLS